MSKKSKLNAVERDLVEGMEGFLADLKADGPIEKKYTSRHMILDLKTHSYTADQIKTIRRMLQASQVLFAQFLGVSVKTVQAWESGKPPSDMACRFLDEIRSDPDHWRKRLRASIKIKTA